MIFIVRRIVSKIPFSTKIGRKREEKRRGKAKIKFLEKIKAQRKEKKVAF
jgi:hypothetical protein